MKKPPVHQQQNVRDLCATALVKLKASCSSLTFAVVVSDDGFDVALIGDHVQQGGRLGSMTSSMQALGDAVTREMKLGDCDHILLETKTGHIIQRRIAGLPLVLCAVFDHHETVGRAIFATNDCASFAAENLRNGMA